MRLNNSSKRLGVFIFFDKDNVVDDYVLYMLKSLKQAVNRIIFVSNCDLSSKEISKVEKYSNDIHLRENVGLDAGAFKYVFDTYGIDFLKEYDELILMNDTFYGPFKPFKEIISEMENKNLDFWGLTANYESVDGTGKAIDDFIHSHIQTYFIAFRKTVLSSDFFNKYWKKYNVKKLNSFETVVNKHESYFTYLLEKEGFKWDTYVNLSHYKSDNREYNYNIYGYSAYTLIKYYNCPFIKRKNFIFPKKDALYINNGNDSRMAFDYIKEHCDYDVSLILKNLVRYYNPIDIYHTLNLNYIIENVDKTKMKKLVFAEITDIRAYDLLKCYLDSIRDVDFVLVSSSKRMCNSLSNVVYASNPYNYLIKNSALYQKKYDYVCLLYLDGKNNDIQERIDSVIIRDLENSVHSDKYINGIVELMNINNFDVMFIPESMHNRNITNLTGYSFKKIQAKYQKSDIVMRSKYIAHSENAIWIKSKLLSNLESEKLDIRTFIAVVQYFVNKDNGLVAKAYNRGFAVNDIECLKNIIQNVVNSDEIYLSYPDVMIRIGKGNVNIFRRAFRRVVPYKLRKKMVTVIKKKANK